jgi:hypothetical protein
VFQRRDIFVMKFSLTKSMMVGLLLCLAYYAYASWISFGQLSSHFTLWLVILFGSSFAGLEVSVWLLMPFSEDAKRALGFLLGINGAISAVGWIFLNANTITLILFMFGLVQFFYFWCVTLQAPKDNLG